MKNEKLEITKKDLKELQKKLKGLDKGWVERLEKKIINDHPDSEFAQVNDQKIYNIFNQRLSNGAWKRVVYKAAKALLIQMQEEITEVKQS